MSVTGFFISFEQPLYRATSSPPYQRTRPPHSIVARAPGVRVSEVIAALSEQDADRCRRLLGPIEQRLPTSA